MGNELKEEKGFQEFLYNLLAKIHKSEIFEVLSSLEDELKIFLSSEKIILYKKHPNKMQFLGEVRNTGKTAHFLVKYRTDSLLGRVAISQKNALINSKVSIDKYPHDDSISGALGIPIASTIVVPISRNKHLLGILQLVSSKENSFEKTSLKRACALANLLSFHISAESEISDDPFELLVVRGFIDEVDLEKSRRDASCRGISLAHFLGTEMRIPESELGKSLENYYQVPFMKYDQSRNISEHALDHINRKFLERTRWLPIDQTDKSVTIVMEDPKNAALLLDLEHLFFGKELHLCVGIYEDFSRYLTETHGATSEILENDIENIIENNQPNEKSDDSENENESTIRLVNELIETAYLKGASDIHIEPLGSSQGASVRIRIDGECSVSNHIPESILTRVISRIKVITGMDITERRLPQDGKCSIKGSNGTIEARVASIPNILGHETIVIRILSSSEPLTIEQLNLSKTNLDEINRIITRPHGLFLVVGPTGSGKTTTLHGFLHYINKPERVIWTVEDPVEITQAHLQQVQVNHQIQLTFAKALRAFLRADPDVIMVGEMRDTETAHVAIQASLTGHLVFSTLHTNSAPETIIRIRDMGIDSSIFTDSLLGILAQRLVRRLCDNCKADHKLSKDEVRLLIDLYGQNTGKELSIDTEGLVVKKAMGCDCCSNTGYKGRVAIHELLINSDEMKKLILKGSELEELVLLAAEEGMLTLLQDGVNRILEGQIDLKQLHLAVG